MFDLFFVGMEISEYLKKDREWTKEGKTSSLYL
jgi:hypothetical protein